MRHPVLPELPGTKTSTKDYTWSYPWLQTQAAEDGLVGHQREERPLVLERLDTSVWGNAGTGKWERVDWGTGG